MTDEEREKFEAALKERRKDLVRNPEGVREVIRNFDKQVEDIVFNFSRDYERYAGEFLRYRNNLARYIGDPIKSFDDYKPFHRS